MKQRETKVIVLISALAIALSSCSKVQKYEDVSAEEEHISYIGTSYESEKAMHISGVSGPPEYEKEIDYYVLSTINPGWNGPEVITRETLNSGIKIKIVTIEQCTNCLFGITKLKRAKIKVTNHKIEMDLPIYLRFDVLSDVNQMKKLKEPNKSAHTTSAIAPR